MMMIAEHWIDETSAGGRMLRPADRQAIAAFVTAHAACQVDGVSQLTGHVTILEAGVVVWWTCARCGTRMPAIAIGFPIWERIITAMRPQ